MISHRVSTICALVVFAGSAATASAVVHTLADRNSSSTINDASAAGMNSWVVDGTNQLFQQWFWYRVGPAGPEQSIDTLNLAGSQLVDTNFFVDPRPDTLSLLYNDPLGRFSIQPTWTLRGSTPGSNRSDITEAIVITNNTNAPLPFHFFQYCDFDLGGTAGGDNVGIPGPLFNTVIQSDGPLAITETVVTPQPSRYEVGPFAGIRNRLTNGVADNLLNFNGPLFNIDATWAFQWDFLIGPNASVIISKDKGFVPTPGALALLGLGGLVATRRRR